MAYVWLTAIRWRLIRGMGGSRTGQRHRLQAPSVPAMTYRRGAFLVITGAAIWSLMGLVLRQIETADTWQVLLWRSVGAALVLGAWVAFTSGGRPLAQVRATGRAGVIGGLSLVAAFAGAIYAIQTTTVANAVFLFSASPFLAALLGWLVLREPVRPATWAAMALAGWACG